ncbi:hypothetical protein [Bradyrhizobium sp. B117]|uniref:hypothetical protein n=1 Tax=Bradyrhizobium sp. B117 TaxID=3140246 RepID=UPI003184644E
MSSRVEGGWGVAHIQKPGADMVDRPPTPSPDLDPEHRQAICDEIGDQLRGVLADDAAPLPTGLESLVERLTELDDGAPSTAADGEEDPASLPFWRRIMRLWWFCWGA